MLERMMHSGNKVLDSRWSAHGKASFSCRTVCFIKVETTLDNPVRNIVSFCRHMGSLECSRLSQSPFLEVLGQPLAPFLEIGKRYGEYSVNEAVRLHLHPRSLLPRQDGTLSYASVLIQYTVASISRDTARSNPILLAGLR